MVDTVQRSATRIGGFARDEYDFQLMRLLGAANYGGAAPGEVFAARAHIAGDDPAAWPPAFANLAASVQAQAAAAQGRHPLSARDHWLRASMYWRCAEYFADPFLPQQCSWGQASRQAFQQAMAALPGSAQIMPYAFEGRQLPGYFLRPPGADVHAARPTVLAITGFDGTAEELYFQTARAGLERGFNVAIAEGPGQMGTLRDHPDLAFRPDYEAPIGAMLDAVLAQPGVDPERLALYGISFGGYFALRGAAFQPCVRALILNSPITNLHAYMLAFLGGTAEAEDFTLDDLPDIPEAVFPALDKLMFKAACRRFGVSSYFGWLERLQAFTAEAVLDQVTCPALALAGSGEGAETERQFQQFCQNAGGPVTAHRFEAPGTDMHCQLGNLPASNAVVYDWLERLWPRA